MSNSFSISTAAVAAGWLVPAFGPFAKTQNGFKPELGARPQTMPGLQNMAILPKLFEIKACLANRIMFSYLNLE